MTSDQRKELTAIHGNLCIAIQQTDAYGIGSAEGRLRSFLAKTNRPAIGKQNAGAEQVDEPSVYESRGPLVF